MTTPYDCTLQPPVDVATDEEAAWRKRFNQTLRRHPDWAFVVLPSGPTPISKGWKESL